MFKIAEELLQKIEEIVTVQKSVLAEGNMNLAASCTCGSHCSFGCGRACSTGCSSAGRL